MSQVLVAVQPRELLSNNVSEHTVWACMALAPLHIIQLLCSSYLFCLSQASSSSQAPLSKKKCQFLCGAICQQSKDPVDPDRPTVRWGYDTLSHDSSSADGNCCWLCLRTWSIDVQHTAGTKDRRVFCSRLSTDMESLHDFQAKRKERLDKSINTFSNKAHDIA